MGFGLGKRICATSGCDRTSCTIRQTRLGRSVALCQCSGIGSARFSIGERYVFGQNGQFSLAFLRKPETEYALKASFTGCMPLAVALDSEADTIRLGTLRMRDDALRLSEVVVTAPLKAVEQKEIPPYTM